MTWAEKSITHHREQAARCQREIDDLAPEQVALKIARLEKERDQWNRLADEMVDMGQRGLWDE